MQNKTRFYFQIDNQKMLSSLDAIGDTALLVFRSSPLGENDNTDIGTADQVLFAKSEKGIYKFEFSRLPAIGYVQLMSKVSGKGQGNSRIKKISDPFPIESGYNLLGLVRSDFSDPRKLRFNLYFQGYGSENINTYFLMQDEAYRTSGASAFIIRDGKYDSTNIFEFKRALKKKFLQRNSELIISDNYKRLLEVESDFEYRSIALSSLLSLIKQSSQDSLLYFKGIYETNLRTILNDKDTILLVSQFSAQTIVLQFIIEEVLDAQMKGGKSLKWEHIYNRIVDSFEGKLKEKVLAFFLSRYAMALRPSIVSSIDSATTNSSYRKYISKFFNRQPGKAAYNFRLPDVNNKIFTLNDFKGKVVLLDFWYTGCTFCVLYYKNVLKEVEELYKDDPNVIFVTINTDKEFIQFKSSIESAKYAGARSINLYTAGLGFDHPILKYYNVTSYPFPMLIDKQGLLFPVDQTIELRNREKLIQYIEMAKSAIPD